MQLAARHRADQQARRIRWEQLLQTRRDYVSWTEFYFWARSIMEADAGISDWLGVILKARTPGFIEYELEYRGTHPKQKSLPWHRLTEWINEHIFESAHRDGWLEAITFYAARALRFRRAMAYWRECRTLWRRKKPHSYPPFEEWRRAAGDCAPILRPEISTIVQSSKQASTERFAAEVERYIDWEAFAHWARSPLAEGGELPPEVEQGLQARCPDFSTEIKNYAETTGRGSLNPGFAFWRGVKGNSSVMPRKGDGLMRFFSMPQTIRAKCEPPNTGHIGITSGLGTPRPPTPPSTSGAKTWTITSKRPQTESRGRGLCWLRA